MSTNMAYNAQVGIATKTFIAPLASYTQANCQVTLTDTGYRIYRPPNKTTSNDGNTMWGGFVLRFTTPPFIKGHTYIICFDVKGQTTNGQDIQWSNNMGWAGGGLTPSPSNVSHNAPGANFQSTEWYPFYYKWTINDDVYKTCTSSYSSFVSGNTYPSYRDWKFGFVYSNTGTLGTDLYINNVRLYDITTASNQNITKSGILYTNELIEVDCNKTSIMKDSNNIRTENIYEY